MKKTIIIVSSIVLLLGINFASAMKVLPPLAIAEPLNAFEAQIWSDIQILQNQISNLAQRLNAVEQNPVQGPVGPQGPMGPQGPNGNPGEQFHLKSATGEELGLIMDFADNNFGLFHLGDELTYNIIRGSGDVLVEYRSIVFDGPNCTGNAYTEAIFRDKYQPIGAGNPTSYRYFRQEDYTPLVLTTQSYLATAGCANQVRVGRTIWPILEISLPITLPIALPYQIVSE